MNIGVVGYGYWGTNLVRNIAEVDDAALKAICDSRTARLALAQRRYPGARGVTSWQELVQAPDIDVVVIATPVSSHFEIALAALRAGKHVFTEKPMAMNAEQCSRLIDEAAARKLVLMVDHTFVYTSAVRKMHDMVVDGSLGDIYYYDSVRVNLGLFQHDVNVIWDLAVHDLGILHFLLAEQPIAVSATGIGHVPGAVENLANMTMFFNSPTMAHIHVNWLAPVKVRSTLLGGSRKMIVYDDLEPSEKIKVYDCGITVNSPHDKLYSTLVGYRTGDMSSPRLEMTEALTVAIRHLIGCIEHGTRPVTDGEAGLSVVRILEAASASMYGRGRPIDVGVKTAIA